jgi:hypothetical protein
MLIVIAYALTGLLVKKDLLQRMRLCGTAEAFDGDDLFSGDTPNRFGAAFLRCAVDQHYATAALLEPAAKPRTHQAQLVAQNIEQRRFLVVERYADRFTVDEEIKRLRHEALLESELLA